MWQEQDPDGVVLVQGTKRSIGLDAHADDAGERKLKKSSQQLSQRTIYIDRLKVTCLQAAASLRCDCCFLA